MTMSSCATNTRCIPISTWTRRPNSRHWKLRITWCSSSRFIGTALPHKQWEDEVIAAGWAYGGGRALKGKTLQLVVTTGSAAAKYQKDGEYGRTMDELLSPFEMVAYKVEMTYRQPYLVQGTSTIDDAALDAAAKAYPAAIA